jgi:cellulose synthase/poly-beta-1,6-N-acetylglucosamine synthase-like glycosyltransferase
MEFILFSLYFLLIFFVFSFSLMQISLIWNLYRHPKTLPVSETLSHYPDVLIQLPIYNEKYVIERLLLHIDKLNYPKSKIEIQILDDSNDETSFIIQKLLPKLQHKISHIQRPTRKGYKAGALAYGMQDSDAEFIGIFDADFLPDPDFLLKTLPYFENPKTAVVQTRWSHLNENFSLLTKLQAFGLDAHFYVEQGGRNSQGHFINFNGTGGIWRKKAIEDAGGWEADTLTEDLDLSYKAQNKSWEFVYLENLSSPAELPIAMSAIKSQQFRWTKGAAQCAVKNLGNLFLNTKISLSTKLHGFYHLMNSSMFVSLVSMLLIQAPLGLLLKNPTLIKILGYSNTIFQTSWLVLGIFYYVSFKKSKPSGKVFSFAKRFFLFLIFMMGLSVHNTIAVIEGWFGVQSPFIRTPKFNNIGEKANAEKNAYLNNPFSYVNALEFLMMLYAGFCIYIDIISSNFRIIPFHFMIFLGFFGILIYTFKTQKK